MACPRCARCCTASARPSTHPHDLVVFAHDCPEQVATYLLRQYLRGRITGVRDRDAETTRDTTAASTARTTSSNGDYLVRVDDTLEFQPGWLDRAIGALEADPSIGCLSLVQPPDYHRKRGRPATVHVKPQDCERLDMRCYVTRQRTGRRVTSASSWGAARATAVCSSGSSRAQASVLPTCRAS